MRRPTVYEINTAVWLRRLGRTLGDVPARRRPSSAATCCRFISRPEPVGHSTFSPSP